MLEVNSELLKYDTNIVNIVNIILYLFGKIHYTLKLQAVLSLKSRRWHHTIWISFIMLTS